MPARRAQERSPAANIHWPFGYCGTSHKSTVSSDVMEECADGERNKDEQGSQALLYLLTWMGCKITVVWLNRTIYYHQMICSSQTPHSSPLQPWSRSANTTTYITNITTWSAVMESHLPHIKPTVSPTLTVIIILNQHSKTEAVRWGGGVNLKLKRETKHNHLNKEPFLFPHLVSLPAVLHITSCGKGNQLC